jgi:hypothetical protein
MGSIDLLWWFLLSPNLSRVKVMGCVGWVLDYEESGQSLKRQSEFCVQFFPLSDKLQLDMLQPNVQLDRAPRQP